MDERWLAEWRRRVQEAADAVVAGFEDRYGFPPGAHTITDPDERDSARLSAARPDVPQDLLTMFTAFGAVDLPDIGNGLWVHDAGMVADGAGEVRRVTGRHSAEVLVFASDGGGTMYALALPAGSPVYRLPNDLVVQGVYESTQPRFEVIATDLADFLDQIRDAVERFASTGEITMCEPHTHAAGPHASTQEPDSAGR